jgi:hypothetical protein
MSGKKKMQKAQQILDSLSMPYKVRYIDNRKHIPSGAKLISIKKQCTIYSYKSMLLMENDDKKIFILEQKKY